MADEMSTEQFSERSLDAAFEVLRRRTVAAPSEALIARILADAAQAAPAVTAPGIAPVRRQGLLQAAIEALGGWRPAGAVAASAVVGLGLGMSLPASVAQELGISNRAGSAYAQMGDDMGDDMDFDGFSF